jgi:hydrogenase expression/formation protein HypC
MCLSVPAKIISIEGDFAAVEVNGVIFRAGIQMIENPAVEEYILLHAGFGIQKINEREALETLALLRELEAATRDGQQV